MPNYSWVLRMAWTTLLISMFIPAYLVHGEEQNVSEEYGRFIQAFYHYEKSDHNPDLLRVLTRRAVARQQLMSALLENDPQQFLLEALPASLREELPDSVKQYVESFHEYEGELRVQQEGKQAKHFELKGNSGEVLQLHFAADLPQGSATWAKVRGVYLEGHVVLTDGGIQVQDQLMTFASLR